jgi:zinc transporter 9
VLLCCAAVLGLSSAAELYSLRVAFRSISVNAREQGQSLWQFMARGNDPTTVSVLAEDAGAVTGLAIAGATSYLTWATGNPVWDACGSITIGLLMGGIAVGLIRNNKRFLIGQAMRPDVEASIVKHIKGDAMVLNVIDPKSEAMADGVYRFKAEIQWSGDRIMHKYLNSLGRESLYSQIRASACSLDSEMDPGVLSNAMDLAMMEVGRGVIRTVGEEIDRLEAELKAMVPGLVYVDLETDRGRAEHHGSSMECPVTVVPGAT